MSKNLLVVSVDVRETRVALIENGIIAELHIERRGHTRTGGGAGDVYLGKVTRVLPGLQAAFVDIGLERAAFLHVEDLIRPDDFDAYLAGGRKHARGEASSSADDEVEVITEADAVEVEASVEAADAHGEAHDIPITIVEDVVLAKQLPVAMPAAPSSSSLPAMPPSAPELPSSSALPEAPPSVPGAPSSSPFLSVPVTATEPESMDLDMLDLPGFTITEPGEPIPRPSLPRVEAASDSRRGRGPSSNAFGRDRGSPNAPKGRNADRGPAPRRNGRRNDQQGRGRDPVRNDRSTNVPGRISKSTPIRDVVREGQDIIVQITKEPIGTKGARCSSHISLPGRYVVYLPTVDHLGVSKRIGSEKERVRLRAAIEGMKPPTGGLIVRTVAEGLTKKQLKQDVGYLVRLWGEIAKKRESSKSPACLSSELDIVLKASRDLFTDEVQQVVIDDKAQYDRLCRFVEMFMPERLKDILYYSGDEPIFDAYGIEDEISRALARKVPLPSGGHLIIDQAEALTAIDVNTGRFVGKGSKDMEETILKTNIEAVNEIAYQLRFRNIGGLIILDLIDMEKSSSREKVRRTLEELLEKDKAKTTLNRISDLGLIEMTRKRTRESLGRLLHEPCFYCDGTGQLQSKETIAFEILREIRRKRGDLPGYTIVVHAHPAVADLLNGSEKEAVQEIENRYARKVLVTPRKEYHVEQFDLQGK